MEMESLKEKRGGNIENLFCRRETCMMRRSNRKRKVRESRHEGYRPAVKKKTKNCWYGGMIVFAFMSLSLPRDL